MIRFRLNDVLEDRDWSAYRLAQESGLHEAVISKLRNNKARRIDLETLSTLCEALECTAGDLIEYVPDKPDKKAKRR